MKPGGFGEDGSVDIKVGWNGVPLIYKNVVMLGATVGEVSQGGESGDSRAYDAKTGAKLWEFHSVPRPGEPGHETWLNDGWKDRSGNNVWGWYLTLDEKSGTLFMPFGLPRRKLLGRRSARHQPFRKFCRRRRCGKRKNEVVLPDGSP